MSNTAYLGAQPIGEIKKDGTLVFRSAAMSGKAFPTLEKPEVRNAVQASGVWSRERVAKVSGSMHYKENGKLQIWVAIVGSSALVETVAIGDSFGTAELVSVDAARKIWSKFGKGNSKILA